MLEEATNNGMVSDSSVGIGLFGGYRTLRLISDSSMGIGLVGLSDNVVSDVSDVSDVSENGLFGGYRTLG